jgi:(p)ppGpp synthase/HD superfamily hydrolase
MIDPSMLSKMLVLITEIYGDQVDLSGKPYIMHLLRVMANLNSDDIELNCIALGHDLIEDGRIKFDDAYAYLSNKGFSHRIIKAILLLTRLPDQSYINYIDQIIINYDAIRVKLADIKNNLDMARLKKIKQSDIDRQRKYIRAAEKLFNAKNNYEKKKPTLDTSEPMKNIVV